jgi:hypothetical protein
MLRSLRRLAFVVLASTSLVAPGCSSSSAPSFTAPARVAGARSPRTGACAPALDPTDCLLPWPSSTWTRVDASSPTGVRLAVDLTLNDPDDDPTTYDRADGFSRLTPLMTGFSTPLDPPPSDAIRLFLVEPGRASTGAEVPLRIVLHPSNDNPDQSLLVATPRALLEPGAEYVAVLTSSTHAMGGVPIPAERSAALAMGATEPTSQDEANFRADFAPDRAVLEAAGLDASRVLRIWSFTTRSTDDGTRRLAAMQKAARAAVSAGTTTVTIDTWTAGTGSIAAIVEGHVSGLPTYMTASATAPMTLDAGGLPVASGVHDAPFRVAIPSGAGTYPFIMYGHGTGGNFHDSAFDSELTGSGIAKVGISFYGWTSDDVISTFFSFSKMAAGTHHSSAMLMQAIADASAIELAVDDGKGGGAIGDALAAAMLGGKANPVAGRRPSTPAHIWAGGSLGGTMGLVYSSANAQVRAGVLNVPGAGWTHFIPESSLWGQIEPFVVSAYGEDLGVLRALFMSQTNWDDIDGGVWKEALSGRDTPFLIQESIGDPVLPNVGTENVVHTTGAVQIGAALAPISGVSSAEVASDQSGFTQYFVSGAMGLDVHGFAAKDTPAGAAAREQIRAFIVSVLAGAPKITVPAACMGGRCSF